MEHGLEHEIEERIKRNIRIRFSRLFNNLAAEGYVASIILEALDEFVSELHDEH